jgi:general nucleoside transport system permease protein
MADQPSTAEPSTGTAGDVPRWRGALGWATGSVPVSIVLALLIGAVAIAIAGKDPLAAYRSMVAGALTGPGLANTLQRAIPIVGLAMALAIAFRAGVFNLGAEGQMVLGGLAGTIVAIRMPGPGLVVLLTACLAAIVAGALWGALSAVLQTGLGVPILITSLLLNYPARYLSSYLVRFPLKDQSSSMVATRPVPEDARIAPLIPAPSGLGRAMSASLGRDNLLVLVTRGVNWSIVVVLAIVVLAAFVNRRTPGGLESGLAGLNPRFARYGGVNTSRLAVSTMMISGGISGLIGVLLVLGSQYRLIDGALVGTNYAWTGLLVALLAANRPLRVLVVGAFFAALVVGGEAMQRSEDVSAQISQVIQAAVIVLIAIRVRLPLRTWSRPGREPAGMAGPTAVSEAETQVGRV